ncbi:MAG: hypothetical protein JKY34_00315 [Kordiimonadaceae bacterium]|nr:hypothetical protein [Kordiimonadaceae bacterium]
MTDIQVHSGEDIEAMGERFKSAWKRAEAGEDVNEQHLTFASMQEVASCFTNKRMELLSFLKKNPCRSMRELSRATGRDFKNINEDVHALIDAGVIQKDASGLHANIDYIHTSIAIG